jgi:hypothetical protein
MTRPQTSKFRQSAAQYALGGIGLAVEVVGGVSNTPAFMRAAADALAMRYK